MKIIWNHKSVKVLVNEYGLRYGQNPIEIIRSLSRELILQAFTREWKGPPFDIIELAKMLGFEVMPNDAVPDARIISKSKGKFLIEYNPFQYPSRINFSIAHEIGHTLFSDCGETIRNRSKELEDNSWELEFLCNVAAAEILLPYAKFSKDANRVTLNLDGLMELAELYKASLEAVFIRFCEVINKPCAIVLARFSTSNELTLDYMVRSTSSEIRDTNEGYIIPKESKAYECIKSGWTSHSLEQWSIFNGETQRIYCVGLPAIRRQKQSRVGILIIPEEFDMTPPRGMYSIKGDATEPRGTGNKIIAQVVNTSAGVGFGFGRAMAKKFPLSKKALEQWKGNKTDFVLGESQLVKLSDDIYVFQMVAQKGIFPKFGEIPLKYSSLHKCLIELAKEAKQYKASVHMPLIGAGQGKGDWQIIEEMIVEELVKKGIEVTVYIFPAKVEKNKLQTGQLFN